ncbi:rhodanese-like domain-containing protein [Rhodococcus sp. BP-252]|uniref:Sulfurtransferase n=1 Tax=Rhodococcoides kyotonense TaxID=398843 RepID=A0A177Y8X8_9NOCA|nr:MULTISPECIES: rhodanese-like domain-containing protein [Rhodococcus]MBY6411793.1 rhodanese-like domain-containing protein [Rhodococcus sp. BP-320]MBY6416579.1 rhodanese-like domain-containing protein [Rhodococcus sp. BP-321]MBY6420615.1 rhodanese-like domain-containing protein [Rhodococcus sp. BP-324]MBY6426603.1 rhodanese-like domain-containing protein [Rhodococcus sp. BP-323]MBY6431602.1 rhodanese-like domain-containing protein [Rhodococcus sp. BP-322]
MSAPDRPSVPAAELPLELTEPVVLLDVREDDEWQQGHAPGAVHIPMTEVPSRIGEIDIDAELYVVCRQGGRSLRVVEYLQQIGYDAVNVDDGMVGWQVAGRPLVRDDGADDAKIF